METKQQFLARYYAAAEAGASKAELQAMIDEYQASAPVDDSKKKDETSVSEPTSELDFTDSTSGLAVPAQEDADVSGASASTPITFDPYQSYDFGGQQVPGADAQLIYNYGQEYEAERLSFINKNFDLAQYYQQNGMAGDAERVTQLAPEQLELERNSVIQYIEGLKDEDPDSGYIEYGKGLAGAPSQDERNYNASVFDNMSDDGKAAIYRGYGQTGGLFEGFASDPDPLGLYAKDDPRESLTEEEKVKDFEARHRDYYTRLLANETRSFVNQGVEPVASNKFSQSLGRDLTEDERRSIEQNLYRNYNISTDLTGEGYVNESGRGWLGVTDVFGPGLNQSMLKAWDGVATTVENMFGGNEEDQAYRQQRIKEIGQEMAVATRSLDQKLEDDDWDGLMSDITGQFGASIPMMGAAMITGAVTKSPKASAAAVSVFGAATIYSENREQEWFKNLDEATKLGFVTSSGIAEGLPAFVGSLILSGSGVGAALTKTVTSRIAKNEIARWTTGMLIGAGLGAIEEGITEGVTAGWQYNALIDARRRGGEAVSWNYDEYWRAVKQGAIAGIGMGGGLALTGQVARSVASKGLDLIRTSVKITELKEQFSQAESKEERATIGKRIIEAVDAYTKLSERRATMMEHLAEASPETYERLVEIHNRVQILGEQYTRADKSGRAKITKEVRELLSERGKIEGDMDSMFETDGKLESKVFARAARKAAVKSRNWGGLFEEGRGKVTVTKSNLSTVAQIIKGLTEADVSPRTLVDTEGKVHSDTSRARIVRGMQNAINMVKAVSSLGDVAVDMYRDLDTYIQDMMDEVTITDPETGDVRNITREEATAMAGRGMWMGDGKIKLFLPSLLENTAYHEGNHDFVIQTLGRQASVGLAKKLFTALPKELVSRYADFLRGYGNRGSLLDILSDRNLTEEQKFTAADEFLQEFLADLSAGNVDIEVQKSVIRQFMDFLAPHLGRIGVRGIPNAKIDNVVSAIQQMTKEMAEGRRLEGQRALSAAVTKAGYASMAMKLGIAEEEDADDGFDQAKAQATPSSESKIEATVVFLVGKTRVSGRHKITRVFEDEKHLDNFIKYMERTKGWEQDEVYVTEGTYKGVEYKRKDATPTQQPKPRAKVKATEQDVYSVQAWDQEAFVKNMAKALQLMKESGMNLGIQVTPLTVEDVKKIKDEGGAIYSTSDNKAGAYIKRDGYMGGLWKNPESSYSRVSKPLQDVRNNLAKKWGMKSGFFDAYATDLERQYVENGWKPVARLKFNPEFAPEGWNEEGSPLVNQPDVVFFVEGEGKVGDGKMYDDYMGAYSVAETMAKGEKPKAQALPDPALQENAETTVEEATGITPSQREERRTEIKLPESQRQTRNNVILQVLNKYELGEITQEDYLRAVRENMPIKPFEAVPEIPSVLDIASALDANKLDKGIIGVNKQVEDGYYVGLRLDIPAYDNYDTWVVSVHQGKKAESRTPFLGGKSIGYGQTAVITNATFDSTPTAALNIAGGTAKTTIARMFGDWMNESSEQTRQRAVDIMAGPEYNSDYKEIGKMDGWVQVGMNPFRHSWFYDKRDGRPVAEASEVIQVGALVLAKDAVKISESDPRFEAKSRVSGRTIKFQRPGSTGVDPMALVKAQKVGIFDFEYTATTPQMEAWLKSGLVRQEELDMLEGRDVLSHSPDNMMVGSVSVDGRVIATNGGGLFYSANSGDVWAVAGEQAGNNMVKELNSLVRKSPDGKAYLLLSSGSRMKHRSSTNGVMSMANLGRELVNQGVLTRNELKQVLKQTIQDTEDSSVRKQVKANEERVKNNEKVEPIRYGTGALSSLAGTMDALFNRFFVEFASSTQSTFEQRKDFIETFGTNIGKLLADKVRNDKVLKADTIKAFQRIFGVPPISAGQFGSTIKNLFFDMFQEKVLQGSSANEVYAAIEIDSEVELEIDPDPLASYPLRIVLKDKTKTPPKTIVFKNMRTAVGTLKTRSNNPNKTNLEVGDVYINDKGKKVKLTDNAFQMMGGMGQATWGRMTVKSPVPVDTITREVVNVTESKSVEGRAKAQGNLMKLIADMVDPAVPTPGARVSKRGKLTITPSKTELWNKKKSEVLELLVASGMSKENAEALYANAKAYKEGRTAGRKSASKEAQATLGKRVRALSTEAKALKRELEALKNKAQTVEEFLSFAINLVDERMKGKGQQPFGNADIQRLFKIVRQAHKSSAARIKKEGGAEVMDSFVDKLIEIFDKQDAKQAMRDYLAAISAARKLQSRLSSITKKRKKGEALKSVASYAKVLGRLADINPALLSPTDVMDFINTLNAAVQTVSKVKTKFDPEEQRIVAEAPARRSVETLLALADKFKALEELGRGALLVSKAKALAEKNGTKFEDEYSALLKTEQLKKVSGTRRAILKFIEDNPNLGLDPANPADVEYVLNQLAENKALLEEQSKEAIIGDVLLPLIAFNLDKLLEDRHIAEILGIYDTQQFNASQLVSRLMKLDKIHLANLEFKLDDYIMNDSVMGLGYLASRVRGRIELSSRIKSDLLDKGIKAGARPILALLDTADSFLRLVFTQDNKSIAKIRRLIGFADMERAFAKADMIHAMTVEAISEEIDRIENEGGSVKTIFDNALMQMFSMARQMPVLEEGAPGQNEAEWYLALRDAMKRSIQHYAEQKDLYSKEDIAEMQAAYDYLFSSETLPELIEKVQNERTDLVDMVDFMVGVHSTLEDSFANYVERFLGKNLTRESMYTPFNVRVKVQNEAVDESLQMRQAIMDSMRSSSLANAKKVAGSSFERNPRSITGSNNIIGLDFTKINERTLRENTILSNTVGEVMSLQSVFSGEEMAALIPDDGVRQQLHQKLMQYITQDTSKAPFVFQSRFMIGGKKFRNPFKTIRNAVIVKAFGGIMIQTLKQSTVMISTMANTKAPLQSIPYMIQTFGELFAFAVRNGLFTDSKLALEADGRYQLLQNSPVFSRDYEAGNIDPYTGSIDTETSWFVRTRDKLNDLALQNLKSTDKVAAVSSWFTFYGDYLISEGLADSFDDINWEEQAASPNIEALSYADSMVTKDQAASTPRQAADIYKDTAGSMGAVVHFTRNIVLPFARFAVNKKRSIYSDWNKLWSGDTRKEGMIAMTGHLAELSVFHSISQLLIPAIASLIVGDEEEESKYKKNPWLTIAGSVLADMNPLPPLGYLDDVIKETINKYVVFPISEGIDGTPGFLEGEGYSERYERWKNTSPTIPTYHSNPELSVGGLIQTGFGPYGEFGLEAANTLRNLLEGGNKVYSPTGKEYFVRPEDKGQMDMFFAMKMLLTAGQMAGLSSKEIDIVVRRLDDMPRERALSSEEELAAYETIAQALFAQDAEFLQTLEDGSGTERFARILQEKMKYSAYDAQRAATKFKRGAKEAAIELSMREMDGFSTHIRDIRLIFKNASDAKDYFVTVNNRKDAMKAEEFAEFKQLADFYMAGMRSGTLEESMYYNLTE